MRKLKFPDSYKCMPCLRHLTDDETQKIRLGLEPRHMDSKWVIYFEEPWLFFHRFLTGNCIYKAKIIEESGSFKISALCVNSGILNANVGFSEELREFYQLFDFFIDGII